MEYYDKAGLVDDLEALGFHLVGYGCTTCIGNSGPLPDEVSNVVQAEDLAVVSRALRQPQLRGPDQPRREDELPRVAAAGGGVRAGGDDGHRPARRAARQGSDGEDVYLKDIWPSAEDVARLVEASVHEDMFQNYYGEVFEGDERWPALEIPEGDRFAWADDSTYVRRPTFLEDVPKEPSDPGDIEGARVLAVLGDSVTTDHISPGRRDQGGLARRRVPQGARRRAEGLQLLRLASRQPRGDGARHVRQHPPAQPAGAGHRGRRHAATCRTARR